MKIRQYILIAILISACSTAPNRDGTVNKKAEFPRDDLAYSGIINIPAGMVYVRGGMVMSESEDQYANQNEGPTINTKVTGIYMDSTKVHNGQFADFVDQPRDKDKA